MEDDRTSIIILKYTIAIAIVAGIYTAAFIYIQARSESYSALHIGEYSNYIENGTVSFTYGVDRFGPSGASYRLQVLVRGVELHEDEFSLQPGSMEREVSFPLDEASFPVKVQVILWEGETAYETYFWLKGAR
jgi:hypothetical protein